VIVVTVAAKPRKVADVTTPTMDEGAWADLKTLQQALDESVAACYGWPRSAAQDDAEIVRPLTALNREITEGGRAYDPFAVVGHPT
jgi:hypothetical protein